MNAISKALAQKAAAERALREAIIATCPPGTPVSWYSGSGPGYGTEQAGHVVATNGDRIEVKNSRTGKTRLLHAFWLTERWGGSVGTAPQVTA